MNMKRHDELVDEMNRPAAKHTPGPWKTYELTTDIYEDGGIAVGTIDTRESKKDYSLTNAMLHICLMAGHPEDKANSILISSAPELLAALSMLIDRMDQYGNIDIIRDEGPIEDARAAIQKATGEA
jgi:hypothetical protein